jgi:hypothetical protein
MADRSAPSGGYDFGNKRQQRRTNWNHYKKWAGGQVAGKAVMMLPSLEGDEIDVALSKGVKESDIHVVDKNPAIVATLKRRYPQIHTYGVLVGRAAWRMTKNSIHFASIDLCGCPSPFIWEELMYVATSEALAGKALVSVTLQRGRERRDVFEHLTQMSGRIQPNDSQAQKIFNGLSDADRGRVHHIVTALSSDASVIYIRSVATYRSIAGTLTMLHVICERHDFECSCLGCAKAADHYYGGILFTRCGEQIQTMNLSMFVGANTLRKAKWARSNTIQISKVAAAAGLSCASDAKAQAAMRKLGFDVELLEPNEISRRFSAHEGER